MPRLPILTDRTVAVLRLWRADADLVASAAELAQRADVARSTVDDVLRRLRADGWIVVVPPTRVRPRRWRLTDLAREQLPHTLDPPGPG